MIEQAQRQWRLMSWRAAFVLCTLFVLFSVEIKLAPQPLYVADVASSTHYTQISLSFENLAQAQKPITNNRLDTLKTVAHDAPTTHVVDHIIDTKISVATIHETPVTSDEAAENLAVLSSPNNDADMMSIHAKPIITNPVFAIPPTPPKYPKMARKRGQEGVVLLEVWLDESGEQEKLAVLESSGVVVLDHAALAAVSSWQFEPYTQGSRSIESRIRIPVEFALR